MTTNRRFRRLFREATLAALAVQGASCDDTEVGPLSRSGFDLPLCSAEAGFDPLVGTTPATEVDFLALRGTATGLYGELPGPYVRATRGTKCSGATDVPACTASYDALPFEEGWGSRAQHLAFTRGDEVGRITTLEGLVAFLAPIDTPEEAAFLATQALAEDHYVACPDARARRVPDGFEVITTSGTTCGADTQLEEHRVFVSSEGSVSIRETAVVALGDPNCVFGRLTEGLEAPACDEGEDLGAHFARMAHLEAAAVLAFERLVRELRAFSAPEALVRRAERAARDEVRHARKAAELARRHGRTPSAPTDDALPARSLAEVALENAVEGCVRETYAALLGTYQAERVRDPSLARILRDIARDETRHAALSWDVADFLASRLSDADRRDVEERRRVAADELRAALDREPSPVLGDALGLPDARTARRLFETLEAELFA